MGFMDRFVNWYAGREYMINGMRVYVDYSNLHEDGKIRLDLLNIPSISAGLDVISDDVSQLPLNVYMRLPSGRDRQRGSLDWRLTQQPNDYQNASEFWKTVAMQAKIAECFVHFDAINDNQFFILPFGRVQRYTLDTGEVRYAQYNTDNNGRVAIERDFSYRDVLHFHYPQDQRGNIIPLNVKFAAVLGLGCDIYSYQVNLYNHGGMATGLLTTDKAVGEDVKRGIVGSMKRLLTGRDDKGKKVANTTGSDIGVAALDNGWKWQALNLTPQEMMMLETKKDWLKDVASILKLPEWKMGVVENYHYSTAENAQLEYLQNSLNPLLVQIEREVQNKVFLPEERDTLYVEFNREKLFAIDSKTQAEIDDLRLKNGTISVAEARAKINLNSGPEAQARYVPANVQSADYTTKAEALKLEKLDLENDWLELCIAAGQNPKQPTPPAPMPAKGPAAGADGAAESEAEAQPVGQPVAETASVGLNAEMLKQMQADMLAEMAVGGPEMALASMLRAQWGKMATTIANAYGLKPEAFGPLGEKYLASAAYRTDTTPAYEANRMINAIHHYAIEKARGVNAPVKWIGGKYDGQAKPVGETWEGSIKHPPLTKDDTSSFLVP